MQEKSRRWPVPLDYRILAGNVADRTSPVDNLARLQGLLALLPLREPKDPIVVSSDRAMLTTEALVAYHASDHCYLGPPDPSLGNGAVRNLLAAVDGAELRELAYRPQRAVNDVDWEPYRGTIWALVVWGRRGRPSRTPSRPWLW